MILALFTTGLVLWLPHVSKPGDAPAGCLQDCVTRDPSPLDGLRVITFNMKHGFPLFRQQKLRLRSLAEALNSLQPDLVLLQEVPWTLVHGNGAAFLAELTGMNYAYVRANGNHRAIGFEEGLAVLSVYPIVSTRKVELKPKARLFEHRIALHAKVETPQGLIDSYNVHLTVGDELKNHEQFRHLVQFVALTRSGFGVIGGDFNVEPDSRQIRKLARQWQDTYATENPNSPGFTCCVDNRWRDLSMRIDYLFISRNAPRPFEISQARVIFSDPVSTPDGELWLSDHLGVLVDLQRIE